MSFVRPSHTSLTVASRLLSCDLAHVSRLAASGKLGECQRGKPGEPVLVAITALEARAGRAFSDAEIEAALRPVKDSKRGSRGSIAAQAAAYLHLFQPGFVRRVVEDRDADWHVHLLQHQIEIDAPPLPSTTEMYVEVQDLFSRSQVEQLIENAIQQNNKLWQQWASDPICQAEMPSGPVRAKFKFPKPKSE